MILVDTNVWSEITKQPRDEHVLEWLKRNQEQLALSTFVLAELWIGIIRLPSGRRRQELEAWCSAIERNYAETLISFDAAMAKQFATLVEERKLQKQEGKLFDLLIASQAKVSGMPVATRNAKDFGWTGVRVVDPWEP